MTLEEEEEQIDQEIEEKLTKAQLRKKKKLKKERKKKAKLQRRIDLKMDLVGDSFDLHDTEDDLFALARLKSRDELNTFTKHEEPNLDADSDDSDSSDSEDPEDEFLYGREKYDEEMDAMLEDQYKNFLEQSKNLQKAVM